MFLCVFLVSFLFWECSRVPCQGRHALPTEPAEVCAAEAAQPIARCSGEQQSPLLVFRRECGGPTLPFSGWWVAAHHREHCHDSLLRPSIALAFAAARQPHDFVRPAIRCFLRLQTLLPHRHRHRHCCPGSSAVTVRSPKTRPTRDSEAGRVGIDGHWSGRRCLPSAIITPVNSNCRMTGWASA